MGFFFQGEIIFLFIISISLHNLRIVSSFFLLNNITVLINNILCILWLNHECTSEEKKKMFRINQRHRIVVNNRLCILCLNHQCTPRAEKIFRSSILSFYFHYRFCIMYCRNILTWGCRGRDRMIVGFTATCTISAYHH